MESLRSHIAYPFYSGAGPHPDYLIDLLPGLLLMGTGIGAGPPILAGAGVSQVHSEHFNVASAVPQTADSFLAQSVLPSSLQLLPATIRPRPPSNHFSGIPVPHQRCDSGERFGKPVALPS